MQVLQINKEHERAKTLLGKARQFKEKREQAIRAETEGRLEDAERSLTEALKIDGRNKGTNANLLAERAEIYSKLERLDCCVKDCEEALALDQSCLAALLQRARCHVEREEWEQAVRIMERMNSRDRHNQQAKLRAGQTAQNTGNLMEAHRSGTVLTIGNNFLSVLDCSQRPWTLTDITRNTGIYCEKPNRVCCCRHGWTITQS